MKQQAGESTTASRSKAPVVIVPLVGSKLRKQLGSRLQEHVSAPVSDFASRQLIKMGWESGTGLGKKRNGIVSHITVKKRMDSAGVGTEQLAAEERKTAESWWKDSLSGTLAKLSSKSGKKSGKKKRKKDYTDEELFEATGGARFGMRAGKSRDLAKWKRTERESLDENKGSASEEDGIDAKIQADSDDTRVLEETVKADKKKRKKRLDDETEEKAEKRKAKKAKKSKDKKKKSKGSDDVSE
jgi:Pin2-interacting protein X1